MGGGGPRHQRPGDDLQVNDTLKQLDEVLAQRRNSDPGDSYVAGLYQKGLNKILEKVGEECVEVIIAAKDAERSGDNQALLYEIADLWFHSLVLLSQRGSNSEAVLDELARRFGLSGLEEKRNRNK